MILAITGGTGSLGRAILQHQEKLKRFGVTRIRIISRDEIKQDSLEKNYKGDIEIQPILADVRSKERLQLALKGVHFLIHAAALKIVPKIEYDVPEAYRTNLGGTENVMMTFLSQKTAMSGIFVSTDKAVDPLNAYGFSKAAAERLWLWSMMIQNDVKMGVCRYGNVFGSRGSVIEQWSKLLDMPHGRLGLTSDSMTRFFIQLSKAAEFVIDQLFYNDGGEIAVPKMKATLMTKLGEVMARKKGREADFLKIGIREGEKIHEHLTSINEKYVYDREPDVLRLRPLPKKVECYKALRAPQYLSTAISSETVEQLTEEDLLHLYEDYLKCSLLEVQAL